MHPGPGARGPLNTTVFRPPRALGAITAAGFAAWALLVGLVALRVAAGAEAEFRTFLAWAVVALAAGLSLLFGHWAYAVASLAYEVRPDALVIRWGFRRVEIPLDSILRIIPGRTVDVPPIRGLNWWGCHVGQGDVRRLGYTLFYSTHRAPQELVFIHTTEETYGLTVLDQAPFAEAIQSRVALGPLESHPQRSAATGIAAIPFWRDRVAISMAGLATVACAVLCGYVFARYPGLPDLVRLHFPGPGGMVRVGEKSELLRIAYTGLGILAVNLAGGVVVHARERAAGLWLFAAGGLLQAILFAAAVAAFARA